MRKKRQYKHFWSGTDMQVHCKKCGREEDAACDELDYTRIVAFLHKINQMKDCPVPRGFRLGSKGQIISVKLAG